MLCMLRYQYSEKVAHSISMIHQDLNGRELKKREYLTSLGSIDFTKELPNIPSNTYKNDRGSVCYDINDFSFGIKVKAVGKASVS